MSDQPDSVPAGTEHPEMPFPFPATPPSSFGPETIVNPERRSAAGSTDDGRALPDSGVWKRLFPSEVEPEAENAAGFELEHFTLEERIGAGGMGAVFRAIDQRLQRVVALKVLAPHQSRDVSAVQRFQNEARAAARLDHDNIARVFYVGEDQGLQFIAFEYITGTNVRDLIREKGRLTPEEAVNYTLQIAAALKHTSAAGVVHRDIKPSNIIITPNGRAKLVDLGLARKQNSESVGELTMAGTTLGTFDYISPEQARDPRHVDVRSDIYSLGCTLYHMLTGEPPYPDGTLAQKLLHHQGNDPPDPAAKGRWIPAALSAIVQKMMAGEPRHRHATPDELVRELSVVAARMGLRCVNPEGLIWTTSDNQQPRFWERNLGWIATTAALLLIVFLLNRFPGPVQTAVQDGPGRSVSPTGESDLDPTRAVPNPPPALAESDVDGSVEKSDNDGTQPERTRTADAAGGNGGLPADEPQAPRPNGVETPVAGVPPLFPRGPFEDSPASTPGPRNILDDEELDLLTQRPISPDPRSLVGQATPVRPVNPPTRPPESPEPDMTGDERSPGQPSTAEGDQAFPMEKEPAAISIISGGKPRTFPTLEAACIAAQDGDIISLGFNGSRGESEKPLRIHNKRVIIRAAKDYRPLIEFAPRNPAESQTRMITVENGSVELNNLDVQFTVDQQVAADQWALFLMQGADQVRLHGVTVTVVNPARRPTAVFELADGPGSNLDRMRMMNDGSDPARPRAFEVRLVESFVRGGGDLFMVRHTRPGEFEIEQSIVALEGSLLNALGNSDMPDESFLKLRLEHATCLVGNSLVRIDSGELPREVLPVHVQARNSLIATNTSTPLVAMTGSADAEDFRRLLRWSGERNFYDRFEAFWTIDAHQGSLGPESLDFEAWKRLWSGTIDSDEGGAVSGGLAWKARWFERDFSDLTPADLALDTDAVENPALAGATNGSDAGADVAKLPPMSLSAP